MPGGGRCWPHESARRSAGAVSRCVLRDCSSSRRDRAKRNTPRLPAELASPASSEGLVPSLIAGVQPRGKYTHDEDEEDQPGLLVLFRVSPLCDRFIAITYATHRLIQFYFNFFKKL